jgi:subtilase family serine protease
VGDSLFRTLGGQSPAFYRQKEIAMARNRSLSGRLRSSRGFLPHAAGTATAAAFAAGLTVSALITPALLGPGLVTSALAAPRPAGDRVPIAPADGLVPAGATDEGAAPAAGTAAIRVYLNGRDPGGLQTLARQISTPGDPRYRHFLTPAQYAAAFGPTARQRADVSAWLRGCGLTVTGANAHYVGASGNPSAVQCAVGAPIHVFRWHGTTLRAPATRPSVPRAVGADVLSVSGLSTRTPQASPASAQAAVPAAAATSNCSSSFGANPATTLPAAYGSVRPYETCGYLPSVLRSAYGVAGNGLSGAGTRVAIVDAFAADTMPGDVQTYASRHGEQAWAAGQLTQVVPAGLPAQPAVWTTEEIMDVEAVHATAPGAAVVYVAAASADDSSFVDAISRVVDGHLADIVSGSWVLGADTGIPQATVLAFEREFLQGAVEGIGFLFASGERSAPTATTSGKPAGRRTMRSCPRTAPPGPACPAPSPAAPAVARATCSHGRCISWARCH